MISCFKCRDEGLVNGCPDCGKVFNDIVVSKVSFDVTDDYLSNLIPEYYRGREFNQELLIDSHREFESDKSLIKYCKVLLNIQNIFKQGDVPKRSMIVISPPRFGKTIWSMSCNQIAHSNGKKTFPILDTRQLKRFLTMAVEKPKSDYIRGLSYSYEDFINADVVFVVIAKDESRYGAYLVMEQVLDMRGRNGKITYFLSEYSLRTLTYYDNDKTFKNLISDSKSGDNCKYPILLEYSSSLLNLNTEE